MAVVVKNSFEGFEGMVPGRLGKFRLSVMSVLYTGVFIDFVFHEALKIG